MKKKLLFLVVALVLLIPLIASPASAVAQKMDLRANPPWCDEPGPGSVAGFAILNNDNETDEVVVVVSLKEGTPNRTYGIFLEGYNGTTGGRANWLSWAYIGNLTTNSNGNGNFDARIPYTPGTYFLQVVVSHPWGSWGPQSFGTNIAAIEVK